VTPLTPGGFLDSLLDTYASENPEQGQEEVVREEQGDEEEQLFDPEETDPSEPTATRSQTKERSKSIREKPPAPGEPKPMVGSRDFKLVKAFWNGEPLEPGELGFLAGDIIKILNSEDVDWWLGELDGQQGWVPASFVTQITETHFEEVQTSDQIVEAMWNHVSSLPEELSFKRGDLIRILWDADPHWCHGEKLSNNAMGWFPGNMVAIWNDENED